MRNPVNFRRGETCIGIVLIIFFGTSIVIPLIIDDADTIRQRMKSLGFLDGKLVTQKDGSYSINVTAYAQRSRALSLDCVFRPFEVEAAFSRGILYLEKNDLERAGFSVHEEYLPRGVKIAKKGIAARSLQKQGIADDPNILRIERALEKTKRNKNMVFANCRRVVAKLNQTFSMVFPDVCKTPSPGGPVPIPYPNVSKSSDTAKGSKRVKADQAEIIAKQSDVKKSESDEAGTRSRELQRVYRRTIAKRELRTEEKEEIKKELRACLDRAALLRKTLDVYVEEIEKLLHQAKK